MVDGKNLALCGVLLALVTTGVVADEDANAEAGAGAVAAAESWLALVDEGEYEKSWEESASLFRAAVTAEKWGQALDGARKPLGELVSRKVKTTQYATTLPGAPDSEYVVIQFEASFANKEEAIETVTPMKDSDGEWRVAGYFIR